MFHTDPKQDWAVFLAQDWNSDPPYEISFDPQEGRFLKASRDISKGELILEESPLIRAPLSDSLCFGCLSPKSTNSSCSTCTLSLCSTDCQKSTEHLLECAILANHKEKADQVTSEILLILRVLAQKPKDHNWKSIWNLSSHLHHWKTNQEWLNEKRKSIDFILALDLPDVTSELITTILAILEINSFTGDFAGYKVRLVHPLGSLMNHECAPNVNRYFSGISQGNYLQVKAGVDIAKGEKLVISYLDILTPLYQRRKILKNQFNFECQCKRCQDSVSHHGDSLMCQKCPEKGRGIIIQPGRPCDKCNVKMEAKESDQLIEKALKESKELLENMDNWQIEKYEAFLKDYSQKLHSGHMINISIKNKLVGFYGKLPGFTMQDLANNTALMDRKVALGKECLETLEKIQPGINSIKGLLLYELHLPLFISAQQDIESGGGATETSAGRMEQALQYLEQSLELLHYEQEGTFENSLCKGTVVGLLRRGYPVPKKLYALLGEDLKNTLWS